jgi:hypothetical protein
MRGDPWRGPWPLRARRVPRRATDWVEAAAACVLVGVGLAATAVALVMGLRVCADGFKQAQAESARTRITAVLLDDVTVTGEGRGDGPATLVSVSVPVHWTGGGGIEHTGVAQVHGPLRAGDRVTVWVDPGGHLVGSPVTADEVVLIAIVSGGLFLIAAFTLLAATWCAVQRWTLARNCAGWEREWESIEPLWSGRQRWP